MRDRNLPSPPQGGGEGLRGGRFKGWVAESSRREPTRSMAKLSAWPARCRERALPFGSRVTRRWHRLACGNRDPPSPRPSPPGRGGTSGSALSCERAKKRSPAFLVRRCSPTIGQNLTRTRAPLVTAHWALSTDHPPFTPPRPPGGTRLWADRSRPGARCSVGTKCWSRGDAGRTLRAAEPRWRFAAAAARDRRGAPG